VNYPSLGVVGDRGLIIPEVCIAVKILPSNMNSWRKQSEHASEDVGE
jgi:hypothetical protein